MFSEVGPTVIGKMVNQKSPPPPHQNEIVRMRLIYLQSPIELWSHTCTWGIWSDYCSQNLELKRSGEWGDKCPNPPPPPKSFL
ncbi:hypothetical protein GDO81_014757 [Engystomops pustulosus]|uniref:Uncharacterized protein n=1 Tax=Engystomops pustulosus TaxID=76066 RepID=A0AAV7AMR8_ENGPU|nr:hypothetical protein GDO81_014757 [Engystomops pustulosus]